MDNKRSRSWAFTLNNYTDEELEACKAWECKHLVFGKEVSSTGTPHLQGNVVFSTLKSLAQLKKLNGRANWSQTRSVEESINYCEKDGDVFEKGERPKDPKKQGLTEKRRWDEAFAAAKEGRLEDIPSDIHMRYYSTIKKIKADHLPKPSTLEQLDNEWNWGPTGTGKTRSAWERYPEAFCKKANTHWWDGYTDEEVVIIDDFDKYHVKQGYELKIWLDHRPFPAEFKGGSKLIRPKKIIITSNYHPSDIWDDAQTLEPVMRRVTVTEFKKDQEEKPPAWHPMYNEVKHKK